MPQSLNTKTHNGVSSAQLYCKTKEARQCKVRSYGNVLMFKDHFAFAHVR